RRGLLRARRGPRRPLLSESEGRAGRSWTMSLSAKFGCVLMIAAIVLAPRLLGPVLFPLHDIGFNLETLADLDRVATPWDYLETAARHRPERFFPAYWLGQHVLWRLGGRTLALLPLGNLVLLAALL